MAASALPRDVRRALDLIEAEPARTHRLADLADAAGVSQRTLQKHFRQALGKSPRGALREARLDCARRALLAAADDASVTDIAARCGFAHLGRFSADYKARYGEVPSTTLRRHRAFVPRSFHLVGTYLERPTLALIPFEAADGSGWLARGLAEEVVTAMGRLRSATVMAPAGARYHLRGAVRGDGRRVRATLRLVEASSGRLLWADRYDGPVDDLFGFEERVANGVARAIEPALRAAEVERVQGKEPEQLTAYELTMRALPGAMALEPAADSAALELLDRAMELAPRYARPAALAAWCHAQRSAHHFTVSPARARATALAFAGRAASLDHGDPLALAVLSGAYTLIHDLDSAESFVERALLLDPSLSWAWSRSAWIRSYRGDTAAAQERFQIALDLAPADPMVFLCHIGLASVCFHQERYGDAARWFARGIAEHPQAVWANRFLAAAHALNGRRDEARRSRAALTRAFPDLTISQVMTGLPFTRVYLDHVAEGLETAGMPLG